MSEVAKRPTAIARGQTEPARRIPAWRFVVGAMIHVVPIVGAIVALGWAAVAWLGGVPLDTVARSTLSVVGFCSIAGVAATVVAGLATASLSGLARRRGEWRMQHDPSAAPMRSRVQLGQALDALRSLSSMGWSDVRPSLARIEEIAGSGWNHDDLAFQRISRDLLSTTAVMTAAGEDGGDADVVAGSMAEAFAILAAAAEQARDDAMRDGTERARTQTRYLRAAYAPQDELAIPGRDGTSPIRLEDSREAE